MSDRSSPSSVTGAFVTLSEMTVFSSKWIEDVPNHLHRIVPASKMLWKASMERGTQEVLVPSLLQQWKIQVENVPTQFQTSQEYFKEEWLTRGHSWLRKDPKVITRSFMAPKSGPADTGRACRASSGEGG